MEKFAPKRLTAIVGHYGSGKTEVSLNLVQSLYKNHKLVVMDMDTVNPYYRTKDASEFLKNLGVRLIAPRYANTNVELPTLPEDMNIAFDDKSYTVIMDIGGDDDGAVVLSTYRDRIAEEDYDLFMVVNQRRLQTSSAKETLEYLYAIESASRLKITGIINSTNLGQLTTADIITDSFKYIEEVSKKSGVPIVMTAVKRELISQINGAHGEILPIDIHIRRGWDI